MILTGRLRNFNRFLLIGFFYLAAAAHLFAGHEPPGKKTESPRKAYITQKIRGTPPKIDGKLNDACWKEGTWAGDFIQQRPLQGALPSQSTEIKILYDEHNIYVAIRAYDNEPKKIDRQLGRRDAFTGDIVGVCFDSYHDYRTGFEFNLTAGCGKIDLLMTNSGHDLSWDAVWFGKTAMEDSAWTAEMQIPLSQLRYSQEPEQVWGLHAWRWINRNQEECQWSLIPRDSPGPVYDFGELRGITNIPRSRRIELLPYTVASFRQNQIDPSNPFLSGNQKNLSGGMDGKIGLSSDFTMDFTILPDFGQVEADPSVVNLSAYETYFEEKRPFFLEGRNIYQFDTDDHELVYTRRIGHAPSVLPDLSEGEYFKSPNYTRILGALKLSGKSANGLSLGIIESLTSSEYAQISNGITRRTEQVEPATNYFVSRIEKDFDKANTVIGGIFTAVNRDIHASSVSFLNREAYTAGLDFRQWWKNKTYYLDVESIMSHIRGSKEALYCLQTSSARYFQRPDADYVTLDTNRRYLTGTAGSIEIGKGSNGPWRYSGSFSWSSPGLELNDIGFMRSTDKITQTASLAYIETRPGELFRSYTLALGQYNRWDFGGKLQSAALNLRAFAQLKNMWSMHVNISRYRPSYEDGLLRGGPSMKEPGGWSGFISMSTNSAKKVSIFLNSSFFTHDEVDGGSLSLVPGCHLKLARILQMSSFLSYSKNLNDMFYITTAEFDNATRYITSSLEQERISLTLRLDYTLLPGFTIQYYGSPFVASAITEDYKRITNPVAKNYGDRFTKFTDSDYLGKSESVLEIDENHDQVADYIISKPDFLFRQFRSNLVARWEYKAGSSLYFVWSQGRTGNSENTATGFMSAFKALPDDFPNNVFLIKLNYWFSL